MVTMEMPQVNVLSKIDLFDEDASFNLEYFTRLPDVSRLLEMLNVSSVLEININILMIPGLGCSWIRTLSKA